MKVFAANLPGPVRQLFLTLLLALPAAGFSQTNQTGTPPFVEFRTLAYGRDNFKLTPQTSLAAADDAARVHRYEPVSLPQKGWPLTASFDFPAGTKRWAVRLRYKLEGHDVEWRDLETYFMHVVLKFLDESKSPVSREEFRTSGRSVGWSGELETSKLAIRTEAATVPPRAAWLSIWIDSGGHDEATGVWLVDNFKVWEAAGTEEAAPRALLEEDFESGRDLDQPEGRFNRWVRDGGDLNGAHVWSRPPADDGHALMILDSNPRDYVAWRLTDQSLIRVVPGQKLVLKWDEIFSTGCGRGGQVNYPNLPSGHYQLRVQEVSAMGVPTGEEAVLPIVIAPPFYANGWFQTAAVLSVLAAGLGVERFMARARMRRKLAVLERRQAVQQERARIARDIHDELGTVLSRIAMVSESAALEAEAGSRQRGRLDEICEASRELTQSMEEIVWAQDPRRDYLDNLVDYFCNFATKLLSAGNIACRLDIPVDLPCIPLDAEKRHELFVVFKEALNNVIKHAGASEVRIVLKWQDHAVWLEIADNGRGFNPADATNSKGNGLLNMRTRLQRVGGRVEVKSEPGQGTRVEIFMPVNPESETAAST
jgi:signal transduction histidine kinase